MFSLIRLSSFRSRFARTCQNFKYSSDSQNFISVSEDSKKRVAVVTMQRPPVNSANLELLEQLKSAIHDLENKNFRGMILCSSSPTVFSAGLDITEMYKPKEERIRKFWSALQNTWKALYSTPMATIAAVNGHAPAGGCLLAMSCDHVVMVKSCGTIGLNETMLGIVAPVWFQKMFINTIGFRQAEQALALGRLFKTDEALALNIVNRLVDTPEQLMPAVQEDMDKLLKVPDIARRVTKYKMRKPMVDELISYEKEELEEIVLYVNQEPIQKALGRYFESLKAKKA